MNHPKNFVAEHTRDMLLDELSNADLDSSRPYHCQTLTAGDLPPSRPYNHEINMKDTFVPKVGKVYPLSPDAKTHEE